MRAILTLVFALSLGAAAAQDSLLGAWVGVDDPSQAMLVEETRVARAAGDGPPSFMRRLEDTDGVLVIESSTNIRTLPYTLDGDRLEVTWFDGTIAYRRVDETPEALVVAPLDIPPTSTRLDFDRIDALVDELARRRAEDQRVRQPGTSDTPDWTEMIRVDRDNTAWLRETIADVGWIDAARFGRQAANGAFLIVQHSGDLELMVTALPAIEADVKAGLLDGGGFALLYDRLTLNLGGRQRYGSQLGSSAGDPTTYMLPMEDRSGVDARRAELGMSPLADYIALFEADGDEVAFFDDVAADKARAALDALER